MMHLDSPLTVIFTKANNPNCCTGSFNNPNTCKASGVAFYSYFSTSPSCAFLVYGIPEHAP